MIADEGLSKQVNRCLLNLTKFGWIEKI